MDLITELKKYKEKVDKKLKAFFDRKLKEVRKTGPTAARMIKDIRNLVLSGGKRARPALMYWGYKGAGGRLEDEIVEASMSIELTHIFLLIHDDIIDRDSFRHGVWTIHERYRKIAKKLNYLIEPEHFGNSIGIIAGDMAAALGNEIIFNSRFPANQKIAALNKLQYIVKNTVSGEVLDIVLEARGKATEKEILKVHENKTAKYTIEGPLHLGAMLAGGNDEMLESISRYAIPVGIAFQIQDDILGVFGNEKKLGKPVCSDLREGKQTLLLVKALEKAGKADRERIKSYLGKKDLKMAQINDFRRIIIKTGSLDYSKKIASQFVSEGLMALKDMPLGKKSIDFLAAIANYVIKREL